MIYHQIRVTFKKEVSQAVREENLQKLRDLGTTVKSVQSWCVGRDFGGEFEVGAMYSFKDVEGYKEYMLHPDHRAIDESGLPIVENMISQDLTDDPDPLIGEKIAKIHADRFASDKDLVDLVNSLSSYQGSSAEKL